jgi:RNA polymerase sigma-70 factor (ECF subfamily)
MSSHSISLTLRHALKRPQEVCGSSLEKPALVSADEDLMGLVQKGDHEAFGQIFDRYYIIVRSIARRMLKDPEDVADVLQESFLDVYQNARSFEASRGTLKSWISCLTYHRALKRVLLLKKRDRESDGLDKVEYSVACEVKPEQLIRSVDFRRCLSTVLGALLEKQRRTMLLYFYEEKELSAIAAELRESLGNTRHYLYRGLAKLRRELVQNGLLQGYIEFIDVRREDKVPD